MLLAARNCVRPKHNNVSELAILGTRDCHGKISPVLAESEARLVAYRIAEKFFHLLGCKYHGTVYSTHAINTIDYLRNTSMPCMRRENRSHLGTRGYMG